MATTEASRADRGEGSLQLSVRRLERQPDAEGAFAHLYGDSPNSFWLDSHGDGGRARFSFIGDASGPLSALISYEVSAGEVRVRRAGAVEVFRESIFEYLERELRRLRRCAAGLPFELNCGFVGYLGYELKADCDGEAPHRSPTPDAAFIFADRLIAFDHLRRRTYLICLSDAAQSEEGEGWMEEMTLRLGALPSAASPSAAQTLSAGALAGLRLRRPRERYLADVASAKRMLARGETYEVCLTNKFALELAASPLALYRTLRRANPTPFSALLRFGELAVLSSSPERFLRVGSDRWVEARPIKGTAARGEGAAEDAAQAAWLRADEKNRAENVTIVDLVRNDLGTVCEFGTIAVPDLFALESYATVHQLVSTVRGRLRRGVGATGCVRACFPPGSMTGAPKVRTMQIIDGLEGEARGVYSGAIGYFGLGGGCDLSVVIRTIVLQGRSATVGVGGAIVVGSQPEQEFEEMLLKGRAALGAIDPALDPQALFA